VETKRCEHFQEGMGLSHAHAIYLNGVEHILCDGCYAKLYKRLFSDQAPKVWLDEPLSPAVKALLEQQ
jgi:hypothetical protein